MSETPQIDPADYRRVLGHLPTGVTVVTAATSSGAVGVAIGSFVSISLDPPLVGFFLGTDSSSRPFIKEAGHFCVNILAQDQMKMCGVMASKTQDKFAAYETTPAPGSGAPVLPDVLAVIDCKLDSIVSAGDHDLFIGRVLDLATVEVEDDRGPMVFYKGQYGTFGSPAAG